MGGQGRLSWRTIAPPSDLSAFPSQGLIITMKNGVTLAWESLSPSNSCYSCITLPAQWAAWSPLLFLSGPRPLKTFRASWVQVEYAEGDRTAGPLET